MVMTVQYQIMRDWIAFGVIFGRVVYQSLAFKFFARAVGKPVPHQTFGHVDGRRNQHQTGNPVGPVKRTALTASRRNWTQPEFAGLASTCREYGECSTPVADCAFGKFTGGTAMAEIVKTHEILFKLSRP